MSIATVEVDDSEPLSLVADGESGLWVSGLCVSGDEVKDGAGRIQKRMQLSNDVYLLAALSLLTSTFDPLFSLQFSYLVQLRAAWLLLSAHWR